MNTLIEIVLFVAGMIVGGIWFTGIILSLFHSLPRSIYWIAKGRLKPRACLTYIWVFFAWTGAFTVVILIVDWLFPQALVYLYNSAGFFYGQWFGMLWYLAMSLSKSGRQRLRLNFWDEMKECLSEPAHKREADAATQFALSLSFPHPSAPAADGIQSDKSISDFIDSARSEAVEKGAMTREKAERMITPDRLQEMSSLPQREVEIVGEYGGVLAELPGPLRPLSKLPYPKETIRQAIEKLLARSQDPEYRNLLKTVLLALDDFVPDEEVPLDKEENRRKWLKVRLGVERQRGNQQEMPK